MATFGNGRRVAIVAGVRTPFARVGDRAQDHLRDRAREGVRRRADPAHELDGQRRRGDRLRNSRAIGRRAEHRARSVALLPMLPKGVQAFTVSRACASANQAITDAADQIALGHADVAIAGGAESLSNVPILHSRGIRRRARRRVAREDARRPREGARRGCARRTSSRSRPPSPSRRRARRWAQSAEKMAKINHIPREEQDQFALRSHRLAAAGTAGRPARRRRSRRLYVPPKFERSLTADNGIRDDTSIEQLARAEAGVRSASTGPSPPATRRRSPTAARASCS